MARGARGSTLILVGSLLWIIVAGAGILILLFLAVTGGILIQFLSFFAQPMNPGFDWPGLLMPFWLIFMLVLLVYLTAIVVLAAMCLRRRDDLTRTTLPLVVGILFVVLALSQFLTALWSLSALGIVSSFVALIFPGLILIGAILNRQQARSAFWPPPPPPLPPHPPVRYN